MFVGWPSIEGLFPLHVYIANFKEISQKTLNKFEKSPPQTSIGWIAVEIVIFIAIHKIMTAKGKTYFPYMSI